MIDQLAPLSEMVGTEPLRAALAAARGMLLSALGERNEARHALEEAIGLYETGEERYELARARAELAKVLSALGKRAPAMTEASAAAQMFAAMGAALEARRRVARASACRWYAPAWAIGIRGSFGA